MSPQRKRRWPWILGGILLLFIVAGWVALNRLDSILLSRARTEAQALSQKLGRPVEIGGLSTQLLPRIGAKVSNVSIGAAAGEDAPLLQLDRAEVGVAVGPLWRSRGDDVQVETAELRGLVINIIRKPDGSTNLESLRQKLSEGEPSQPPAEEKPPTDLSRIRVDHAALVDGQVRFLDRSSKSPRELSISDIDIEVKDLRAGQPLDVLLKAAVFAPQQNLEVRVTTAALPPSLVPTPEKVVLKAQPIDLSPLQPFLPEGFGLTAGKFDANWTAELGGAVPGGNGPTRLVGTVHALGLQFADAPPGKTLDVVLDTDVNGDIAKGDLRMERLQLKAGPAEVTGHGSVQGLVAGTPRVEGLELVAKGLDPAVLGEYSPALKKKLGDRIAGPIGLQVRGSGTAQSQALTLDLDLTPVKLHLPEDLEKAPGAPMRVTAQLSGAAAGGGPLKFDAKADLAGVDLRPGDIVNKAPGEPFDLVAVGTFRPTSEKAPMRVDVSSLTTHLLGDTVTGTASYETAGKGKAETQTFALALKSPHLDVDRLLTPDKEETGPDGKPVLPQPKDPERFRGYRGDIRLDAGQVRYKKRDMSNVVARIKMVDDLLTIEKLSTGVYGGQVSADGTQVRLGPAKKPFEGRVQVRGLELAEALTSVTAKKLMGGKFSGDINLKGLGTETVDLQQTLAGVIQGQLQGGTFLGKDILAATSGLLTKELPFASKALPDGKLTSLGDLLPIGVTIADGVAQLKKPIEVKRPQGSMSFDGGIRLDGTLDLTGTVMLDPPLISKITMGKVTPKEPVPLPVKVTGPAWSPEVTGVDLKPAAAQLARQAAAGLAGKVLGGEKGKAVEEAISGGADAAKAQARAKLEEERRKAEEAARAKAEEARKRAEEEVKKRLGGFLKR